MNFNENLNKEYPKSRKKLTIPISIFSLLIISFGGYLNGNSLSKDIQIIVFAILFHAVTLLYIGVLDKNTVLIHSHIIIVTVNYLISLLFIIVSIEFKSYSLFLLGPVIIAMLVDMNLGVIFTLNLSVLFSLITNSSIESFAFYFLLGIIACFVSNYMLDRKKIGYVLAIIISTNITLLVISKSFSYSEIIQIDSLYSILSTLILTSTAYVVALKYKKRINSDELIYKDRTLDANQDKIEETSEELQERLRDTLQEGVQETLKEILKEPAVSVEEQRKALQREALQREALQGKLHIILDENFDLVIKLQNYSKRLFSHSVEVAELSRKAAREIKADELLTKAGGLYHEIGRVISKDYIEEGIKLAENCDFPKEVIDIIKQHNTKYEKPNSIEAAIVMLSDSLVTTIEYISSKQEKLQINKDKLIDNIFQLRLSKGSLDDAGLSIKDMNKLKEFYIKNC